MGGGAWKFGWGPQDDGDSIATIHRALELGINWIDTAPIYGLGHSEEVIAAALKSIRERPVVATKCGRRWDKAGNPYGDLKRASVLREIDESLVRLGVEYIDLYQLHWPIPDEEIEEAWGAMAEGVRSGKVRYLGACNVTIPQLERIIPIHPVASLQPPYSMLMRAVESDLLPFCLDKHIGVISYSPMQKGIFSEKFSRTFVETLAVSDHRRNDRNFQEPLLTKNLDLVKALKGFAHDRDKTVSQLAIAWVLRRSEVTAAIVGARKPSQIEETVGASLWELTDDEIGQIQWILDSY